MSLVNYERPEFGFSIQYPSDWEPLENQFGTRVEHSTGWLVRGRHRGLHGTIVNSRRHCNSHPAVRTKARLSSTNDTIRLSDSSDTWARLNPSHDQGGLTLVKPALGQGLAE